MVVRYALHLRAVLKLLDRLLDMVACSNGIRNFRDPGYIDLAQGTLQPLDNSLGTRVLPMSQV
jgi:hypothetical protein